jgi:phosphohistidine phosphatase
MKTLLLLRHAKSDRDDPNLPDHERPLNKRGKRDAPRIAEVIQDEKLTPDLIITSTAKRACQTAKEVARGAGGAVVETDQLYLAGPDAYRSVLSAVPDTHDRVMLVGHNPGIEEFLADLTGVPTRLPTAALARVDLPITRWSELTDTTKGALAGVWRPKELS